MLLVLAGCQSNKPVEGKTVTYTLPAARYQK